MEGKRNSGRAASRMQGVNVTPDCVEGLTPLELAEGDGPNNKHWKVAEILRKRILADKPLPTHDKLLDQWIDSNVALSFSSMTKTALRVMAGKR